MIEANPERTVNTAELEAPDEKGELVRSTIDRIANSEIKALLAIVLTDDLTRDWTATQLQTSLIAIQNEGQSWAPDKKTLFNYCLRSMSTAGFVSLVDTQDRLGRPAKGFRVNKGMAEIVQGVCGLFLQWSYNHPELDLRQVLGVSAEGSNDGVLSPERRATFLLDILTNPKPNIAYSDLVYSRGSDTDPSGSVFRDLHSAGIIKVEHADNLELRRFNITEGPFIPGNRKGLHTLRPESAAIYRTAQTLKERGQTEIDAGSFIEEVVKLNPDLDMHKVRLALRESYKTEDGKARNFPVLGSGGAFNEGLLTKVSISPEYYQAVQDLVKIIYGVTDIGTREEFLKEGMRVTEELLNNPGRCTVLAAKARASSTFLAHRSADDWYEIFASQMEPGQRIALSELHTSLQANGITQSIASLKRVFRELSARGLAETDVGTKNEKTKRAAKYVTLKSLPS